MNLLHEPWLPVRRRDGSREWIAPNRLTDPDIVAVSFVRSTPIARCILAEGAELVVNGREFRRQAMRMGGQEKNRSALRRDRKLIGRGVAHQRLAYL